MRWFYEPLLLLLASTTKSDLAKQVQYFKADEWDPETTGGHASLPRGAGQAAAGQNCPKGIGANAPVIRLPGARSSVPRATGRRLQSGHRRVNIRLTHRNRSARSAAA